MTLIADARPASRIGRVAIWGAFASGILGVIAAVFLIGADQLRAWCIASRSVVIDRHVPGQTAVSDLGLLVAPRMHIGASRDAARET